MQKLALVAVALVAVGCTAMQPPNAGGPRSNEPLYPILMKEDSQRRAAAQSVFDQLAQTGTPSKEARLTPVTGTIQSLPANLRTPLYLPKLGTGPQMTEDEIRESLRRFINEWRSIIGADPVQLSLIERTDEPDGTKWARYEQRPFRYPLRGNYGKLRIHFAADRRILDLSSTCIPDTEHLQAALAAITPQITSEEAIKRVQDNAVTYVDTNGNRQTYKPTTSSKLNVNQLVIYALNSTASDAIEFHLAWEVELADAPIKAVYVDAVKKEIIGAG
jgi:hypothetical protein